MIKKFSIVLLLFVILIFPSITQGQDMPPGKWWKDPEFVKKLNINESQTSRLDDEFVKSRRLLIELKNKVERERFELDNLFDKKDTDKTP